MVERRVDACFDLASEFYLCINISPIVLRPNLEVFPGAPPPAQTLSHDRQCNSPRSITTCFDWRYNINSANKGVGPAR